MFEIILGYQSNGLVLRTRVLFLKMHLILIFQGSFCPVYTPQQDMNLFAEDVNHKSEIVQYSQFYIEFFTSFLCPFWIQSFGNKCVIFVGLHIRFYVHLTSLLHPMVGHKVNYVWYTSHMRCRCMQSQFWIFGDFMSGVYIP